MKRRPDAYSPGNTRTFLGGLMDWVGDQPPTADGLAGHAVAAQGWAHVLTVHTSGGLILGHRYLDFDGIGGLREVSHRAVTSAASIA